MNDHPHGPFKFAINYDVNYPKEFVYMSVVMPMKFDDTNHNNLIYMAPFEYYKSHNLRYLVKVFINMDSIENSFSKVYPLQNLGGMMYCPLDLEDSQIDIGLLVFKEHIHEDIVHNICIPEIPPMPEWMPRLHHN